MHCNLAILMAQQDTKLSQRQLAKDTNLSLSTINKLYHGRPLRSVIHPETVQKICEYFSCDIGDLFTMKEVDGASN